MDQNVKNNGSIFPFLVVSLFFQIFSNAFKIILYFEFFILNIIFSILYKDNLLI